MRIIAYLVIGVYALALLTVLAAFLLTAFDCWNETKSFPEFKERLWLELVVVLTEVNSKK